MIILLVFLIICIFLFSHSEPSLKPKQPLSNFIPTEGKYKALFLTILLFIQEEKERNLEIEFSPNEIAQFKPDKEYPKSAYEYLFNQGYLIRGGRGKYKISIKKWRYIEDKYLAHCKEIDEYNDKIKKNNC